MVLNLTGPLLCLVFQGTVLGPLLSSLYIQDIPVGIDAQIRLFADDCLCYRRIKTVEDTLKLQKDIDLLGSWVRKLGMRFQPVECNMMQLKNKWINKNKASYTLEGTVLENVDSIKYVGVTTTNDLGHRWHRKVVFATFIVFYCAHSHTKNVVDKIFLF